MRSRRHHPDTGFMAAQRERLFGNSNWDKRRRVIYLVLLYCAGLVAYIVFKGQDTALNAQTVIALIALAGGVIGSYCFAAVWDDNSKRDAAVAARDMPDDDDDTPERPIPPTHLPTDRN